MPPESDRGWRNNFVKPPSPDTLKSNFEKIGHAFNLNGDGPKFMQDFELKEGEERGIDKLLIEMPGGQTIRFNTDHFVKRGGVNSMCLPCCSMALFTLQTNAPTGGKGHRTSLRGGGPLTTIILGNNLWETVLLNVLNNSTFSNYGDSSKKGDKDIFPWMGVTRTSEKGQITTPIDVNPAQMFWGMPRRIKVFFNEEEDGLCDICGKNANEVASMFITKSYGVNYENWRHILSPYRKAKEGNLLPRHANPGGISYRHWIGITMKDTDNVREPAVVISNLQQRGIEDFSEISIHEPRIWVFGYDMDNMKARCWYDIKMPIINLKDDIREDYESTITQLIKAAEQVAFYTRNSIKRAMFGDYSNDIRGDMSFIDNSFWQDTERDFYVILNKLKNLLSEHKETTETRFGWLKILVNEGTMLFDFYSQSNNIGIINPRRIALAHRGLRRNCYGPKIQKLLDLPKREKTKPVENTA